MNFISWGWVVTYVTVATLFVLSVTAYTVIAWWQILLPLLFWYVLATILGSLARMKSSL